MELKIFFQSVKTVRAARLAFCSVFRNLFSRGVLFAKLCRANALQKSQITHLENRKMFKTRSVKILQNLKIWVVFGVSTHGFVGLVLKLG